MYKILWVLGFFVLTACSSSKTDKLLPDTGPSTAELMTGQRLTDTASYEPVIQGGKAVLPAMTAVNAYTNAHLSELNRDFRQVPNPQILAYVYPHFAGNGLPVPGYFTVFRLYDVDRYALSAESVYVE